MNSGSRLGIQSKQFMNKKDFKIYLLHLFEMFTKHKMVEDSQELSSSLWQVQELKYQVSTYLDGSKVIKLTKLMCSLDVQKGCIIIRVRKSVEIELNNVFLTKRFLFLVPFERRNDVSGVACMVYSLKLDQSSDS